VRDVEDSELGGSLGGAEDDADDEAPTCRWFPRTLPRPRTRPEFILAVHEHRLGVRCAQHGSLSKVWIWAWFVFMVASSQKVRGG